MAVDIGQAIKAHLEAQMREIQRKAEQAARRAETRYMEADIKFVENLVSDAATHFYKNYIPKYYDPRRGSLYGVMQVNRIGGNEWAYNFMTDEFKYRDGSNASDGLFKTVFEDGYHGGPIWKWSGKVAKHDNPSPMTYIEEQYNSMTTDERKGLLLQYWNEEAKAVGLSS